MTYLGGKYRLRHWIASHLKQLRQPGQPYWEPFVGSAAVLVEMDDSGPRFASDIHEPLIELWLAIQDGWIPPDCLTEAEYAKLKAQITPTALQAFAGFACSFCGKYFGGFARGIELDSLFDRGYEKNYARIGKTSLAKSRRKIQNVKFSHGSYNSFSDPEGCLIYADPPYLNTTKYKHSFENIEFWKMMKQWADRNTVIVSEYQAPEDWICIAEKTINRASFNDQRSERSFLIRTERLFMKRRPLTIYL